MGQIRPVPTQGIKQEQIVSMRLTGLTICRYVEFLWFQAYDYIDPIGDKESRGSDFLYRRRTKPRIRCVMVRGLQMEI